MEQLNQLVKQLKASVSHIDGAAMLDIMRSHYRTLQLLNADNQWNSTVIAKYSNQLLPQNLSLDQINQFIDDCATAATKNQYLMNFLNQAKKYDHLSTKFEQEKTTVMPDVIGYALVLQNLASLCVNDYTLLEELYATFRERRAALGAFKALPLFHKIKLISVEKPMYAYITAHKTRMIKPTAGGTAVAINIWEATWTDFKSGIKDNAFAGKILALNKCGRKQADPRTGAGPSGFSPDGKMIERVYPFGLQWADLYQVWNMCFCTRFRDWVYVVPKLIIPQIANYHQKPKEYIYNRAFGLYIYLNFASFDYVEKQNNQEAVIDWHDRSLSLDFAKVNKQSALHYQSLVDQATK